MVYKLKKSHVLGSLAVAGAFAAGALSRSSPLESSITQFDATGNGIEDVVFFDAQRGDYGALLGQSDGTYLRARVLLHDGIPFYVTEQGTHDPWGNRFPE